MVSLPLTSPNSILPSYMFLSSYSAEKSPQKGHQVSKPVEDNRYLEGRTEKSAPVGSRFGRVREVRFLEGDATVFLHQQSAELLYSD